MNGIFKTSVSIARAAFLLNFRAAMQKMTDDAKTKKTAVSKKEFNFILFTLSPLLPEEF